MTAAGTALGVERPRGRVYIPTVEVLGMPLSKAFKDVLEYLGAVKGYSPRSVTNYQRTGHQFIAFLTVRRNLDDSVKNFTSDNVFDFCSDLGARGAHPNTILNKIHGLSTFARFLMKRKDGRGKPLLSDNPTLGFERPEAVQSETKFLYPDELAAFMTAAAPPHVGLAREVFMDTGIRVAEACEANVGDVQDGVAGAYLTIAVKGRRRKGEQPASIPLSAQCADLVRDALLSRGVPPATEPLLVDAKGHRWHATQLGMAMVRLGIRAGITRLTVSPHKLRHTANVIARQSGVDALTRAQMLNHRSLRTLARYDHLVPGETAKGREKQRQGFEAYLKTGSEAPKGESDAVHD